MSATCTSHDSHRLQSLRRKTKLTLEAAVNIYTRSINIRSFKTVTVHSHLINTPNSFGSFTPEYLTTSSLSMIELTLHFRNYVPNQPRSSCNSELTKMCTLKWSYSDIITFRQIQKPANIFARFLKILFQMQEIPVPSRFTR